jgi:UDP-N-acetylglucosamine--N-acetylmuramyl-(pentapeptide) pyrophosphoryl-undecaprenol N-acetylglucosamine transferase
MGLVNRVMSRFAKKVFLSYQDTLYAPEKKSTVTGNPVRKELSGGTVRQADGKNLLILGGSGGSRAINTVMASCAGTLMDTGWKIRHQTGAKLYEETCRMYGHIGDLLSVEPYIDDMLGAYRDSDFIVARAGSGTVFEALHQRRPALYIPLPTSTDDHQLYNARYAERAGYAKVLEEKDLSGDILIKTLETMFSQSRMYKEKLEAVEIPDSAGLIAEQMGL